MSEPMEAGPAFDAAVASALREDTRGKYAGEGLYLYVSAYPIDNYTASLFCFNGIDGTPHAITKPWKWPKTAPTTLQAYGAINRFWHTRSGEDYAPALEATVGAYRTPVPPYSQDTAEGWWAMQKLIAKMESKGFRGHYSTAPGLCGAAFHGHTAFPWRYAETLPLAVCLAVLDAVQGEQAQNDASGGVE